MNTINYPIVGVTKDQKVFVSFYINNKRYRLFNGKRINSNLNPNSFPIAQRENYAKLLASEVYKYVNKGGVLTEYRSDMPFSIELTDKELIKKALQYKLNTKLSINYKRELQLAFNLLLPNIENDKITVESIERTLRHYDNESSYNSLRKNLNTLCNQALKFGLKENPIKNIKKQKINAKLNKPFDDIKSIIEEVTAFNDKLGLCCLITYGCLLRPHREIRELTWGDFSEDLKQINLSGARNKSGRNRIVPVPYYVQERLINGEPHHNIFTGTDKAPNPDYFKTIWGRFKKVSKLLEQDQTLYSFRHSGAIEIYKRTGSLSKLQKAMGHSSLAVSLTYLRGLEVAELEEDDMPMI
jgi:integrase